MKITKRLFTYPVLAEDKDDYTSSKFSATFESTKDGVNNLLFSYHMELVCPEIEKLIADGLAQYVVHIECSSTIYRNIIDFSVTDACISIPVDNLNGNVEMVALVVLKKRINDFICKDWNEDYDGIAFNLEKGKVLAYCNLPAIQITKDLEEMVSSNSIFLIYKRAVDDEKPMDISINSPKIKIGMTSGQYKTYCNYANKMGWQEIFHAMVIFPALVYVFEELKNLGPEDIPATNWYISMDMAYRKRGVSLEEEIFESDKTSFQLAQEAMQLPIAKAFIKVPLLDDRNDTSEED